MSLKKELRETADFVEDIEFVLKNYRKVVWLTATMSFLVGVIFGVVI